MRQSKLLAALFIALSLIQLTGCGRKPEPAVAREKSELAEFYKVYQHFKKSQERAPAELDDLATTQYEMLYPGTMKALQEGKFVVVWNVNTKDGATVLAYDKDAPEKGGPVLMADGAVKIMSATEFAAAKRAP
jgi:hypothetical protein